VLGAEEGLAIAQKNHIAVYYLVKTKLVLVSNIRLSLNHF
jgi:hypothetical protein